MDNSLSQIIVFWVISIFHEINGAYTSRDKAMKKINTRLKSREVNFKYFAMELIFASHFNVLIVNNFSVQNVSNFNTKNAYFQSYVISFVILLFTCILYRPYFCY